MPTEMDAEAPVPDRLEVPVGGVVTGGLRPPSSKSVSHRIMNLALLSRRPVRVRHLLEAEDLDLFRAAMTACGWHLEGTPADLQLEPGESPPEATVYCGNAGTMFRFLVSSLTVAGGRCVIDGTPRLRERPIGPLGRAVAELGGRLEFLGEPGHAPLRAWGSTLRGGACSLDAGQSSQYLSSLLMACSFASEETVLTVEALVSTPYVDVTLEAMERFGLETPQRDGSRWIVRPVPSPGGAPLEIEVEADYSAAAYPAAAAMITGGEVRLRGLDPRSTQGDRRFLDVLEAVGATTRWSEQAELLVSGRPQRAIDVDLGDMPDQVPTLAAVAAFCPGKTTIRNVAHLRIKESDRLRAVALEWNKLDIQVRETEDGLEIDGRPEWLDDPPVRAAPCEVVTYDDHRIAMSAALVGLRRPLTVLDPGVVAKSYPGFWRDLSLLLAD